MELIRPSFAIFLKEWLEEKRTRFAITSLLAFTASALLIMIFAMRAQQLDPTPKSGLLWIILLFASLTAGAGSFLRERDRQTLLFLTIHTRPLAIYLGKLLYNSLFLFVLLSVTLILYTLLLNVDIVGVVSLSVTLFTGSIGLAGVITMTSAMIAQADRKGALFSVLSIPLLVPLILLVTRTTLDAFTTGNPTQVLSDYAALVGFCGVVITLGVLLFDYLLSSES